ncbi:MULTISPECIES: ribosome hibernation-promoting factor, HPF/YfiA family [Sphingomonas]|jgi:ribosomal subunit interface protein|uniref:Ribosome hibernation promoting factor n=3 Tax=Sphingomonas TaxID=13687 RepID=A0A0A1W747_9SPHN|nr:MULTISPECIES: ribosome-associated translation inhibitor RaiA [Sphingomonas]HIV79034.1 ribosome-associated translation inhibitor RaiA [Candidatus Sphingomonas excrementigallinarum]KTT96164.1 30S ribosomal protein S30 [Sphingomonas yabuuchiae]MBZ6381752.1 ribosome-associated translation inhibitor RaiA [Sphingomonas sanguinis]NNG48356.1 ribosome-associated translation inhibitor RaiA [Sphingomonas sanguinis]NNG53978.1 ribosome-associated translation inhibitor RaiA [Sphingomonas sanguinis]
MDIRISGHQVETGDALRTHVTDRLQGIAEKYFARAISSEVTFGKGPHDVGFKCDIVMHVTRGLVLKGRHDAQDAHLAFDGAATKIEKQLRRYSRRLKDRNQGQAIELAEAGAYDAGYTLFAEQVDEDEAGDAPLIIAETRVDIPDASVSDAVMMLDLRNTAALLFKNSGTGSYNMVYRRGDGTIGWVEPQRGGTAG